MLTERYFASISGPPLTNNTSIAKDVGIYEHILHPSHSTASTFKKSSASPNCVAVSDTHVFSAQDEKSTVHVYSRAKGNQEAVVTFQERIKSIALLNQVLILGTDQGRLIIWETCTGRQITTPACHVQAVTCIAVTPYHLLTGSDDSNINVWEVARLLELDITIEHEPEKTLSNHRAAITSLAMSQSVNRDTNICVSASKDKSCIIWNYQTGEALRILLFPSSPVTLCLDPCARAFYVSTDDGSLFAVELFAEKALIGAQSAEASSTVVQVSTSFGSVSKETRPASCLGLNYDGTVLLSGHPNGQILRWDLSTRAIATEVANLNASVSNLLFVSPMASTSSLRTISVVKPFLGSRNYNFTAQLESDLTSETKFGKTLNSRGFSSETLEQAMLALQQPSSTASAAGDEELRKENEDLWKIINEQRALQKKTMQRYVESKSSST
ncbi:putative WD40-repeat-containing domain protein [Seiridium unicorne]|uniref:Pre-rRNA-processing protein IPI3 n=1 Tax=Seiridium unicorne TaxID=138068 RepID=A0ABR2VF83_9PEZI